MRAHRSFLDGVMHKVLLDEKGHEIRQIFMVRFSAQVGVRFVLVRKNICFGQFCTVGVRADSAILQHTRTVVDSSICSRGQFPRAVGVKKFVVCLCGFAAKPPHSIKPPFVAGCVHAVLRFRQLCCGRSARQKRKPGVANGGTSKATVEVPRFVWVDMSFLAPP